MKIVVTSSGSDLDAQAHPAFGRCPTYLFVDTETMRFEAVEDPVSKRRSSSSSAGPRRW